MRMHYITQLHMYIFNSLNFIKLFVQMDFNTELMYMWMYMYMYMYTNIITRMLYLSTESTIQCNSSSELT